MKTPNIGQVVADIWEQVLRETEDPYESDFLFYQLTGLKPKTYRERLDRIRVNVYGEAIPRIVVVRQNLRYLGNIRLDPNRLP